MVKKKKRILIGTDGSIFSRAAIEEACSLMKPGETEVLCISTYENPVPVAVDPVFVSNVYYSHLTEALVGSAEMFVSEAETQIRKHFTEDEVPIQKNTLNGYADNILIEKAKEWKADLIVVGSHGRGFWGRLLGSVSSAVVHHATCSVLVVKSPAGTQGTALEP